MENVFLRVAGISYRQGVVGYCKAGDAVELVPEPDNQFDPHACKIMVKCGNELLHVGYVPKDKAIDAKTVIAMDEYQGAVVEQIGRPSKDTPLGMVIKLTIDGELPPNIF